MHVLIYFIGWRNDMQQYALEENKELHGIIVVNNSTIIIVIITIAISIFI